MHLQHMTRCSTLVTVLVALPTLVTVQELAHQLHVRLLGACGHGSVSYIAWRMTNAGLSSLAIQLSRCYHNNNHNLGTPESNGRTQGAPQLNIRQRC